METFSRPSNPSFLPEFEAINQSTSDDVSADMCAPHPQPKNKASYMLIL